MTDATKHSRFPGRKGARVAYIVPPARLPSRGDTAVIVAPSALAKTHPSRTAVRKAVLIV